MIRFTARLIVFGITACIFLFGCQPEPVPEKPNIVWFISEDNSPYIGAYGNTLVHTPALDAFAINSKITFSFFSYMCSIKFTPKAIC